MILTLVLFISISEKYAWVNIDSNRRIQLDSIVTNVPNDKLKDLKLLHQYIHKQGRNNEERVWMFYGYFGIHTKYDQARKYDRKALFQTPEYTVQKRKGVCRDFSQVFLRLCDMSNIPCMEITGEAPKTFFSVLSDLAHFHFPNNGHTWNVVKLNGEWLLMDPTWSFVKETKGYYEVDKYGREKYVAKCKIPDRTYYDGVPQNMRRDHKPNHPAFLLLEEVPSWKSSFKKKSKRVIYESNYDYISELDSLYSLKHPQMSPVWYESSLNYSGKDNTDYVFKNYLNYHKRRIPNTLKPTLQDYYCHFEMLDSITKYVEQTYEYSVKWEVEKYKVMLDTSIVRKLENKTFNKIKIVN